MFAEYFLAKLANQATIEEGLAASAFEVSILEHPTYQQFIETQDDAGSFHVVFRGSITKEQEEELFEDWKYTREVSAGQLSPDQKYKSDLTIFKVEAKVPADKEVSPEDNTEPKDDPKQALKMAESIYKTWYVQEGKDQEAIIHLNMRTFTTKYAFESLAHTINQIKERNETAEEADQQVELYLAKLTTTRFDMVKETEAQPRAYRTCYSGLKVQRDNKVNELAESRRQEEARKAAEKRGKGLSSPRLQASKMTLEHAPGTPVVEDRQPAKPNADADVHGEDVDAGGEFLGMFGTGDLPIKRSEAQFHYDTFVLDRRGSGR